jgi:metal transporter CNNM
MASRRANSAGSLLSLRPAVIGIGRVVGTGFSSVAMAAPMSNQNRPERGEGSPLWVLGVASIVLVLLGGAFAGLTIA